MLFIRKTDITHMAYRLPCDYYKPLTTQLLETDFQQLLQTSCFDYILKTYLEELVFKRQKLKLVLASREAFMK